MMRSLALAFALLALPALAAKPKVVLDAPKPVSPALEKALKAKYTITKTSLAPEPTGGDVKAACLDAGGAIAVITARPGGGDLYTVMVLNGADGSPLGSFRVKAGKKPLKALSKPDAKKLGEGLKDARAPKKDAAPPPDEKKPPPDEKKPPPDEKNPPADEKKPDEKKPDRVKPTEPPPPPDETVREDPEPRSTAASPKPWALRAGVGFKLFNRLFGYTDDIFDALSTYYLPRGPAIAANLEVYPAAFVTGGPAAHIGLLVDFDYAVGISSKSEDGTKYGTTALNLRASLIGRIPISRVTINPFFGYALQTYGISSSSGTKPNIPNVSYGGLRGGLELRIMIIGPVGFQLGFAGTYLLSKGEVGGAGYFPRAKANGIDANGALVLAIGERIEVTLGGEYQRYWYSMNPEIGDPYIAGGALDIYVSGKLGLAFKL